MANHEKLSIKMAGLGYFASLPYEVRIMIYRYIMPENSFSRVWNDKNLNGTPIQSTIKAKNGVYNKDEGCCHSTAWANIKGILSLLSTSRKIYQEVYLELHRERELVILFNPCLHINGAVNPYDEPDFEKPSFGRFPTRLGDFCSTRDFTHTDFSRFASFRLEIFFPPSIYYSIWFQNKGQNVAFHKLLRDQVEQFTITVEQWQRQGMLQENGIVPACPKINIVINKALDPMGLNARMRKRQMTTADLKQVLEPLTVIKRVGKVTFDVRMEFDESFHLTTSVLSSIKAEMESSSPPASQKSNTTRAS